MGCVIKDGGIKQRLLIFDIKVNCVNDCIRIHFTLGYLVFVDLVSLLDEGSELVLIDELEHLRISHKEITLFLTLVLVFISCYFLHALRHILLDTTEYIGRPVHITDLDSEAEPVQLIVRFLSVLYHDDQSIFCEGIYYFSLDNFLFFLTGGPSITDHSLPDYLSLLYTVFEG